MLFEKQNDPFQDCGVLAAGASANERALAGHKKERMQPHPPIFQILQTFSGLLKES